MTYPFGVYGDPGLMPGIVPGLRAPVVHFVRRGETLSIIARKYGTTVHAIMAANNLRNPHVIYPGQRLIIP
ncbi:MAG TPA: LysM domain-containing protein [Desulfobacteria bacterium]|nr:LysM domain-containing protein [Desulfobacteria bacterium]